MILITRLLSDLLIQQYADSVPVISLVLSKLVTAAFAVTAVVAGLLTLSTASLQSVGAFPRPSSSLTSDPGRNLFVSYLPILISCIFIRLLHCLVIY